MTEQSKEQVAQQDTEQVVEQIKEQDIEQVDSYKTETTMAQVATVLIYACCDMALQVKVTSSSSCDLRGGIVDIVAQDIVVMQVELTAFDDEAVSSTDKFVLQAPTEPGEYTWTAVFTPQEIEGVLHEPSSGTFSFVVKPHVISLAFWDAPFPAVIDSKFRLKVGARCSAGCKLTGEGIEIYDHQGVMVATGTLGDDPWRDTVAMYWAELELQAPSKEDYYKWQIRCPEFGLKPKHEESVCTFAFRAARPPEHVVTIEVASNGKAARPPIRKALVTLYARSTTYSGYSDDDGVVRLNVPKGEYNLTVIATDHKEWEGTVEVADDVTIKVEMIWCPEF